MVRGEVGSDVVGEDVGGWVGGCAVVWVRTAWGGPVRVRTPSLKLFAEHEGVLRLMPEALELARFDGQVG
jgi:hypothetical protein